MIKCANCGRENPDETTFCVFCGELVDPEGLFSATSTRQLPGTDTDENQPRWGTARFDNSTLLILRVVEAGEILTVELSPNRGAILGRRDPDTGDEPEVDLTPFKAQELGVSRRHARIDYHQGSLRITDLGSVNSTFLNGLRLTSNQPRILRDGDELRIGRLKMQVSFVDSPR